MDSDSQTRNRLDTLQIAARGALKAAGRIVPNDDRALPADIRALGNVCADLERDNKRLTKERDAALGPAGGFVLDWLEKTLTASASDLDTAGEVLRAQKTLLDDSQADIHAALKAIREAGICEGETLSEAVQALIADANAQQEAVVNAAKSVGIEADDAAQAARLLREEASGLRASWEGANRTIRSLRSELNTAEQRAATNAARREGAERLHAMLDDVGVPSGGLVYRVETLIAMSARGGLDISNDPFAEVDRRTLHVVVTGKGRAPCGFTMAKGEAQQRVHGLRLDYNPRCGLTIEQTLAPDAVDATIVHELARVCLLNRSEGVQANLAMRAAAHTIRELRSAYNTAAQRADSNAQRRAATAHLHGVLDDADIGFGPLRNRVEALVRMVQTAEAPRKGLDAEVERALAQLDAAGFDVMNKGLGALEDALERMRSMGRNTQQAGRALASVGIGWCEHGIGPAVEGLVRNVKNLRNLHDQAIAERDEARAASNQVVRDAKAKLERDLDRLREEAKGAEAEAHALLKSHQSERQKIADLLDAHGAQSGPLAERVANALLKPPATIDVIIDPGHVENAQARAMLAERFTAKMDEPLKFEEQVGLTIEYTSYGTVRVTQHIDVKAARLAVDGTARIADLEAQIEQAKRLTRTHVERSEERYKAACEANDEVRRLKLAVVTLGRCAVELAGGDPRRV